MPSWLDYLMPQDDLSAGASTFSAQRPPGTGVFGQPLAPPPQVPGSYGQLNNQGGPQPVNPQVPTSYLDQLRARTPPIMPQYPPAPFAGATTDASSGYAPYQPPVQSGGSQIPYRYGYQDNPPPPQYQPQIPTTYNTVPNNPGGNIPVAYGQGGAPQYGGFPYPQVEAGYPTDPRVPLPPSRPAGLGTYTYPQIQPGYPTDPRVPLPPPRPAGLGAAPAAVAAHTSPAAHLDVYGSREKQGPPMPTAPAAVTRPPLPTARPAGFGVAPIPPSRPPGFGAPVAPAAQPVAHVAAPAWLGALIRGGQPATGMTGMVRGGNLMDNRQ